MNLRGKGNNLARDRCLCGWIAAGLLEGADRLTGGSNPRETMTKASRCVPTPWLNPRPLPAAQQLLLLALARRRQQPSTLAAGGPALGAGHRVPRTLKGSLGFSASPGRSLATPRLLAARWRPGAMRICRTSSWQRSRQPRAAMTSIAANVAVEDDNFLTHFVP